MRWNWQTKLEFIKRCILVFCKHSQALLLVLLVLLILGLIHFDPFHPLDSVPSIASMTLDAKTRDVSGLAFSPDGKLASSALEGSVKIWDLVSQKEILNLKGCSDLVSSISFSPDGKQLATISSGELTIWDAHNGQMILSIPDSYHAMKSVCFNSKGDRIAVSSQGLIKVLDSSNGRQVCTSPAPDLHSLVVFNGHGDSLAAPKTPALQDYGEIWFFNCTTGKKTGVIRSPQKGISDFAINHDGTRMATASYDGSVAVWDLPSDRLALIFDTHTRFVHKVVFNPDGTRIASGSKDIIAGGLAKILVWDAQTGKVLFSFRVILQGPFCLAFSPDGKHLASSASGGVIKIWDLSK
jgi:WD40 repeat protein